ncbi:MAG: 30S ribosomal protein S20 [Parcubacteria group bacterium GW2011_GWC2_32_10]|nr:MAG: 30S ribosomal protein S20 [Parcubacteria group bacterium GW2011_GWC2_32_10]
MKFPITMAITKSAKKAIRQNKRRKAHNVIYKNKLKETLKQTKNLVANKKIKEARESLSKVYQILDKTAKVGIIKKGEASRKKSRFAKLIERNSK